MRAAGLRGSPQTRHPPPARRRPQSPPPRACAKTPETFLLIEALLRDRSPPARRRSEGRRAARRRASPVLVAAHELLAEVIVDSGIGAAPDRTGEGHGRDAGARGGEDLAGKHGLGHLPRLDPTRRCRDSPFELPWWLDAADLYPRCRVRVESSASCRRPRRWTARHSRPF